MRIYLVIVLLYFITAPRSKKTGRVEGRVHSSETRSSAFKNKGKAKNNSKEVEREESLGKTAQKKLKFSKKSSSVGQKEKKKECKTKEKKKSNKKKLKRKKTKKREDELEKIRSEKIDGRDTKSKDLKHIPSEISTAINQNARLVSSESPSSYTQTTLSSNTILEPRVYMAPITTTPTQHIISSPSTSTTPGIDKNTAPATRTNNSTILTTATQPTSITATTTTSSNNLRNTPPVTQITNSSAKRPTSSPISSAISQPTIITSTPPVNKPSKAQNILPSSSSKLIFVPRQGPSHKSSRPPITKNIFKKEKDTPIFSYQKQAKSLKPEEEAKLKMQRMKRTLAKMLKRKIIRRQILQF
ncbi:Polycystic kidney disease protein 1-like 3 [Nosema bombycis CQ1]|uniref:Polycystic kidney disease protein 1-like 3 n=1 Tax=Nosema bombycis (strain CQ1 / CVCC 102059) TaxID=578461 RepID=R0KQ47_NOSB1|nr:Polycystic kidney disease protein 1-like 3 [Nosema bombycis CQ1]|eukprot:EOB12846.1 Polycystic kidney disease protein 1-like 3 [Nosema bombycis CQ1]